MSGGSNMSERRRSPCQGQRQVVLMEVPMNHFGQGSYFKAWIRSGDTSVMSIVAHLSITSLGPGEGLGCLLNYSSLPESTMHWLGSMELSIGDDNFIHDACPSKHVVIAMAMIEGSYMSVWLVTVFFTYKADGFC